MMHAPPRRDVDVVTFTVRHVPCQTSSLLSVCPGVVPLAIFLASQERSVIFQTL